MPRLNLMPTERDLDDAGAVLRDRLDEMLDRKILREPFWSEAQRMRAAERRLARMIGERPKYPSTTRNEEHGHPVREGEGAEQE